MNYAEVKSFDVDEAAPLIYTIHIKREATREMFVGAAARGSDLPRNGQLWAAQALLKGSAPFPDWFYRCDRVHFAMAEAWVLGHPITLALIGNTRLRDLESDRLHLETILRASLNVNMPEEKGKFSARLRMLRFRALNRVTAVDDPALLRTQMPHLWDIACQTYAETQGTSVTQAEAILLRKS